MEHEHEGHRERMRRQFLQDGFPDSMPEHQLLEMLLFYVVPRKDTNPLAHRLIEQFGSLSGVMDASVEELKKVSGITENGACLIKMILPLSRRYQQSRVENRLYFHNRTEAADYLLNQFVGRTVETVFLLCMDNKGKRLDCCKISEGDEISVSVSARTVVEQVFKTHATVVMLGHNHPMGLALPSQGDLATTKKIATALHHLGVQLLDHIVVSDGDYVSMAETPAYRMVLKG